MRKLFNLTTTVLLLVVILRAVLLGIYQIRETLACRVYCSCLTWQDALLIAVTIYCLIWERFDRPEN